MIDPGAFRQALSQSPTGVSVVALAVDDRIHAMTVGSFTSVSLEPPLVLVCIGSRSRMSGLFTLGHGFSVNVLRAEQQALSTYFAGSWREPAPPPHRFVEWDGSPRLEGVVLSLACRVEQVVPGGDHLVVVGRVSTLHLGLGPREPLVFFDRRYHGVGRDEGWAAPDLEAQEEGPQAFYESW